MDSNISTSFQNIAFNDHQITLEYLNVSETKRRIIPLVFLVILAVIGIPGNILIIFIYTFRFQKKKIHRFFVISLAVAALLVCSFTVPFEIVQMTHEYTFYAELPCKIGRTLNSTFTMSSALILLALSVNRYRRICQPFKSQFSHKQVYIALVTIVLTSVMLSWPDSVLSGIKLHALENNNTGYDCSSNEDYVGTSYPLVYSIVTLVVYMICMILLLVMCVFIGRVILNHVKFSRQFIPSHGVLKSVNSTSTFDGSMLDKYRDSSCAWRKGHSYDKNGQQMDTISFTSHARKSSPKKITRTAFTVSLCFVIVFIPYTILTLLAAIRDGNIMPHSEIASILLPTLLRLHFVNNVLNFIVYVCIDLSFRRHCKDIVTILFYKIRKPTIVAFDKTPKEVTFIE